MMDEESLAIGITSCLVWNIPEQTPLEEFHLANAMKIVAILIINFPTIFENVSSTQ
jgi:hypothetical protein